MRSGFPSSTTYPSAMKITLSATSRANPISCVTTIIVIPSFARDFITSSTSPTSSGSSADVGSSKEVLSVPLQVLLLWQLAAAVLRKVYLDRHLLYLLIRLYPKVPALFMRFFFVHMFGKNRCHHNILRNRL